jgi:hypothetical protein
MRPYLITAKLMRPSNMKRFPTPGVEEASIRDLPEVRFICCAHCAHVVSEV